VPLLVVVVVVCYHHQVVAGKKKRLTFFECPNDVCAMLDLAKTADLVLLLVDGSYGFEMETFEYLNMLQTHGFPKVRREEGREGGQRWDGGG